MKPEDFGYVIKNGVLAFQKGPLSQWYGAYANQGGPIQFEIGGVEYNCMEQYMMYQKAILFDDQDTALRIMKESNPAKQKAFGRKVNGFDQKIWDQNKTRIIIEGNMAKFLTNEELRNFLVDTAPNILVEAAPWDKIWGCGTGLEDSRTYDPKQWQGQNLLGRCLESVRDNIMHGDFFRNGKFTNLKEAVGQ